MLLPERVHVSRSLRRSLRRFEVSVDTAFDEVVAAVRRPGRARAAGSRPEYRGRTRELHDARLGALGRGVAGDRLAGGLFGVEVGGLFAAESKVHVVTDASKVAVVALADLLAADGDGAG